MQNPHHTEHNPWVSMIPVAIGVFMVLLDVSILNVALPSITQEFNARASDVQWILNAYLITLVILLITFGKIGDMVKRNLLYATGMGIFTLGSYLCAQSWSIGSFIAFRVLQAVGGAIMMGNSIALITELFPLGKRGAAMGVNAILVATAFSLGPILGGWLTTHLGWHWVFYINVPIGIAGVTLGLLLLPSLGKRVSEPIDFPGLILLAMGLGFFTLGIIKGQDWGWDSEKTIASFIISFPYLIAFAVREITYEYPLLDLRLFRIRNFTAGIVALFFIMMGVSTSLFLLPFFLQGIKGLTAEESGYWLVAIPIMNTVVSPIAGRLSDKINPKIMMTLGPSIFTIGLYLLSDLKVGVTFWELTPVLSFLGIGLGLLMAPALNVVMASIPIERAGMTSGTINTMNNLAQAMGITFGGVLLTGKMNDLIPGYGNQLPNPGQMMILKYIATFGITSPLIGMVEAFMESLHHVFLSAIPLPLLGLFIILVFLQGKAHIEKVKQMRKMMTQVAQVAQAAL
ncbi:MAG: DHA2 family efflux MFS transporter permease subunit [Archaeoglobus sp.]|nr:DHA2 family efflux MFS transporter permease subunit [Archaeoglobus sp.]